MNRAETASSAAAALTDSRLAALCAEAAQHAFANYQGRFDEITRRARERFLAHDLKGSYADAAERLHLYGNVLADLTTQITDLMGPRLRERNVWTAIKAVYSSFVAQSRAWEIGESFFNSLTRRVFATEGVDQAIEFVDSDFDAPPTSSPLDVRRRLEMINRAFYRGGGSYLVGRAIRDRGDGVALPLAFCLRHEGERGITLDAVLFGEADLSILFSYTRAYFRVNADCPHALVHSLRQLMPRKRLADLYNEIGFNRHAKTEFYRDFVAQLNASADRFKTAEGTPGMVMLVFTLPSYDVVFKVIKDRFDPPKDTTPNEVMRRYKLVFEHDRAGRLVEAHEFEHLRVRRNRFEPALLEDLLRAAGKTVRLEGDDVVIAHAYVERRIRPLNIFFAEADATQSAAAARDYGQAIKDLAVSNIFPGDLLTKNFGVTRRGRVVFYDYDELCFLTDCNFRDLPQASTYEEEISAEPWFSVRENDVFPEEFPNFLRLPGPARVALLEQHADLFHPDFWRSVQRKLREGEILEVFPYRPERRLVTAN